MALISDPQLLLLDEPTCGMSPAETERAVAKIREMARTIDIIIINDMPVVFQNIADAITVMAQGAVLASGSASKFPKTSGFARPTWGGRKTKITSRRPSMLSLRDVHVHIGKLHILQGVSLEVKEGECAALLGRNGVGKTTTLRSIMGLVARSHGVIEFNGNDLSKSPPHQIPRKGIGYVPQGRGIFPTLSVLENLTIGVPGMRDAEQQEYVLSCFPRLKERLKQSGSTLSGGEQQMLAIARCLMMRPKLIILDEPTEGVVPRLVSQIRREIHRINQTGVRSSCWSNRTWKPRSSSARACFSWKRAPLSIPVPRMNSSRSPRSCTDISDCLTKLRTQRENEHGKKVIPPQFSGSRLGGRRTRHCQSDADEGRIRAGLRADRDRPSLRPHWRDFVLGSLA